MLKTKDDINAQKGKAVQLELKDNLDKKPTFFQNPKTVYITFGFTVVISLLLWSVNEVRHGVHMKIPSLSFSPPQTNLTLDKNKNINLDSFIDKNINITNGLWSFYILTNFLDYQKNINQFKSPLSYLKSDIDNLPDSINPISKDLLPQGLDTKEYFNQYSQILDYGLLIKLPKDKQIYVFIKSSNPKDIDLAKNQLIQFIPLLYQQLIQLD